MSQSIQITLENDIAVVRLNDPDTLNAVTVEMIEGLDRALDQVASGARAMVLTGAGRAFCSGANLGAGLGETADDPAQSDAGAVLESHINPLMTRLRHLPVPWISAVRGAAAGVGASLALAADMIVASETAFFLQAFSRIGLVPDGGSSHLLIRTLGRPRAMELMLLGDRLPAAKALEWGLINQVAPDAEMDARALELAARLAQGAASLGLIRRLAWTAVDGDWSDTLALERDLQRAAGRTEDHQEGLSAFQDKRSPRFRGV